MNTKDIIQPMGYTEMYEWVRPPQAQDKFGRFVQFSQRYPQKIEYCHDDGAVIAGVSTICSVIESDDPKQWKYAYMCTETGDLLMKEETLAVGVKCYDQHNEMSYISTRPWKHYIKVPSPSYKHDMPYTKRTSRNEWVRVALLGKTVVIDNGTCTPGKYCQPYVGDDMQKAGTAVPWDGNSEARFYVLERISENAVMIVMNSLNLQAGGKDNG